MVEEQVREEFVAGDVQPDLLADKGEALAQFEQEFLHMLHQLHLQIPFRVPICHGGKSKT